MLLQSVALGLLILSAQKNQQIGEIEDYNAGKTTQTHKGSKGYSEYTTPKNKIADG